MLTSAQIIQAKNTKLSDNFTLYEMIRSDSHPELVVYPSKDIIEELKNLCVSVLQPLRDKFGPIRINSAYRNSRLNSAVGGVTNSIHKVIDNTGISILGAAADIVPLKANIIDVYKEAQKMFPKVKTVILYRRPNVTRTPFIHVDNRNTSNKLNLLEKVGPNAYIPFKE